MPSLFANAQGRKAQPVRLIIPTRFPISVHRRATGSKKKVKNHSAWLTYGKADHVGWLLSNAAYGIHRKSCRQHWHISVQSCQRAVIRIKNGIASATLGRGLKCKPTLLKRQSIYPWHVWETELRCIMPRGDRPRYPPDFNEIIQSPPFLFFFGLGFEKSLWFGHGVPSATFQLTLTSWKDDKMKKDAVSNRIQDEVIIKQDFGIE